MIDEINVRMHDEDFELCDYYYFIFKHRVVEIPPGYRFRATIPRLARVIICQEDVGLVPVLIHDFLYEHKGFIPYDSDLGSSIIYTRKEADIMFRDTMITQKVKPWVVKVAYRFVRLLGGALWYKNSTKNKKN